jgi:hypothetical protein
MLLGGLPDDAERDISAILTAYAGYPVDNSNWQQVDAFGLIYAENGKLHDVSQATIDYRNQYILEILPVLCETYDTIFIVMGCDHAEALKADLETMMENAWVRQTVRCGRSFLPGKLCGILHRFLCIPTSRDGSVLL